MIDDTRIDELLRLLPEPPQEWVRAATEIAMLEVPDADTAADGTHDDAFDGEVEADEWYVEPDAIDPGGAGHDEPGDGQPDDTDFGDSFS